MIDVVTTQYDAEEVRADVAHAQATERATIDAFHKLWYGSRFTWGFTFFENVSLMKNPLDLWIYQELVWDLKPTLIIETGTAFGGSALFFARQLDKLGVGNVVTIDPESYPDVPKHERITYVKASSTDPAVIDAVKACARTHPRVMVVLDSDHSCAHVSAELDAYAPLVTRGQFLVVEDTNICGRPVETTWKGGPGPGEAVDAWLPKHPEFVQDKLAERYLLTVFPNGWLRRVA